MKSPCKDICIFDATTGWCIGCGRTLPECRRWKRAKRNRLEKISAELPARLSALAARGVAIG
ncbi:DUF1289 domain-containing protein [Sphingorhabdus sp.]|uniref:DUF1289 domain-containing protein n=1 Tax=Sphingorhabdus sp. TaxID=1902408 RepID=UPI003D81BECA